MGLASPGGERSLSALQDRRITLCYSVIRVTQAATANPPYSILSYSAGLRGCAMELSLLLPAVNGVLCRVAMSPAAGQGVVFAAAAGSPWLFSARMEGGWPMTLVDGGAASR